MGCNLSKNNLKQAVGANAATEKKVLFLGIDNAGKSTLLFQMRDEQFKETVPTVGLNVESIKYRDHQLTLWDVSGSATRLWKHYFDKINAVIYVIDSADKERLAKSKTYLYRVMQDKDLAAAPILIMCNKNDLPGALTAEEIYESLGLEKHLEHSEKKDIIF
jgi:small GTP-binding protein